MLLMGRGWWCSTIYSEHVQLLQVVPSIPPTLVLGERIPDPENRVLTMESHPRVLLKMLLPIIRYSHFARITNSDGGFVMDMDVTNNSGNGDIKLNSTDIIQGGPISTIQPV